MTFSTGQNDQLMTPLQSTTRMLTSTFWTTRTSGRSRRRKVNPDDNSVRTWKPPSNCLMKSRATTASSKASWRSLTGARDKPSSMRSTRSKEGAINRKPGPSETRSVNCFTTFAFFFLYCLSLSHSSFFLFLSPLLAPVLAVCKGLFHLFFMVMRNADMLYRPVIVAEY